MTLRDALRVIGRWKWLILLLVVAIPVSAYGFSSTRTPQYTAQTQIKYEQQVDISNPLGGTANPSSYQVTTELQSVASVVASPEISAKVAAAVGLPADSKQLNVKTSVVANTSVVQLSVTNPDPTAGGGHRQRLRRPVHRLEQADRAPAARAGGAGHPEQAQGVRRPGPEDVA